MVEVNIVELKCSECDTVIGHVVEDESSSEDVYCSECYGKMKDDREEFEETLTHIHELSA